VLSLPALADGSRFQEKDLLAQGVASTNGKLTLDEHLTELRGRRAIPTDAPLLALGLRNNLVNLRAPVIWQGRAHAVEGERPEQSLRPYYGIGTRGGRLTLGQALGGRSETWPDFFCAGVPVLWDDLDQEALLDLMLAEAGDHSHIFDLPRGTHPDATDATRAVWARLHDVFRATLHADRTTAVQRMRAAVAAESPLRRCDDYLHAVLGVRDDGTLVCVFAHGRLETLGAIAKVRGCRRAVCVENSGSIMPTFLPSGMDGEQIPLLHAPNFRPRGRVLLFLQLETPTFGSLRMPTT
jgi:hypothetical protein